jgi:hypothetical protein
MQVSNVKWTDFTSDLLDYHVSCYFLTTVLVSYRHFPCSTTKISALYPTSSMSHHEKLCAVSNQFHVLLGETLRCIQPVPCSTTRKSHCIQQVPYSTTRNSPLYPTSSMFYHEKLCTVSNQFHVLLRKSLHCFQPVHSFLTILGKTSTISLNFIV